MDEKNNEITNEIQPGSEIPILCLAGFFLLPHLVAFLCTFALPFETGSWGAFGTVFSIAALPTPITTPIGLAILIVADLSGGICKYRNYVVYVNGGVKVYRRGGAKVYQLAHDGLMLF